jgi:hypothetical protein
MAAPKKPANPPTTNAPAKFPKYEYSSVTLSQISLFLILLRTNPYADKKSVAFQSVAQDMQEKMVRPRSMSVLLECTTTN